MKTKRKFVLIIIISITIMITLSFVGIKLYVENNYDVKIISSYSVGFYSIAARHNTYYLVNSSLGVKTKTREFDVKSDKLSIEQLQQLNELSEIDDKFIFKQNNQTNDFVFFYENYIFYMRFNGQYDSWMSDEDLIDSQENIYQYNIGTKEIQQIKITQYEDKDILGYKSAAVDIMFEALNYLYPKFKEAISNKCDHENHFGAVFYDNGRIFFSTYFDSGTIWESNHLYEYLPTNNEVKKIASTRDGVVSVEVVK